MVKFQVHDTGVVLTYQSDLGPSSWVRDAIKDGGEAKIGHTFHFEKKDLIEEPSEADHEGLWDFEWQFRFADIEGEYYRIAGRKLGIENDVLFAVSGPKWSRKLFAAERNVSIFLRISNLLEPGQEIVVGGNKEGSISLEAFEEMLKKFPNSGELDRYANARVATIIGDYVQPQRDFRAQYEKYLNRRRSKAMDEPIRADELVATEIEKFDLVRDTIQAWLASGDRSEDEWQKQILAVLQLIFPKYIAIVEKVPIDDRYSDPSRTIKREIDIALVDVNGNIDVIEIKKPMDVNGGVKSGHTAAQK